MAPQGKSKAIASDSALNLMKSPCREAKAVRQGLWAWAGAIPGRFMILHKRFRSRLSLGGAGLSALGSVSQTRGSDGLRLLMAMTAV